MNSDKLYEHFLSGYLTDTNLVLEDELGGHKTYKVHKLVLCSISSTHFLDMLNTECIEKQLDQIELQIEDVCVATLEALIVYFYQNKVVPEINNIPIWQYRLELLLCFDYFGLPYNKEILSNVTIPLEGFLFLFLVANELKYPDYLIEFINDNLPKKYNLKILPVGMQSKIIELRSKLPEPEHNVSEPTDPISSYLRSISDLRISFYESQNSSKDSDCKTQ